MSVNPFVKLLRIISTCLTNCKNHLLLHVIKIHSIKTVPYFNCLIDSKIFKKVNMGLDKLFAPLNNSKRDICSNISNIRLATSTKPFLVKISSDEIKAKRISAYKYLLP